MPYREMYSLLFNAITDALNDLEQQNFGRAKERLMHAQLHAEALYSEAEEESAPGGDIQ